MEKLLHLYCSFPYHLFSRLRNLAEKPVFPMKSEKITNHEVAAKLGAAGNISRFERRLKWFVHDHCIALGLLLFIVGIIGTILLYTDGINWQIFLAVFGGLFSFVFLVQKQQLEEAKFANDLINRFNDRYDSLNEEINRIACEATGKLSEEDKARLYDYFNLCAEEYLFYARGYIYPSVWASWLKGMEHFAKNERIRACWHAELVGGSYYGLNSDPKFRQQVLDITQEHGNSIQKID